MIAEDDTYFAKLNFNLPFESYLKGHKDSRQVLFC